MNKILRPIVLIAVGLGSIASAPAEPRKATARWVVNYDDAQCVASRNYGSEEKPLFLAFKPSPTGNVMRLMLMRNGYTGDAEQMPAVVRFDDEAAISANALAYSDRATKRFITAISLPMQRIAEHRTAAAIAIKGSRFDERLAVGGFSGVMAAFDDCLANLRTVWNVDAQSSARLKEAARPKQPLRDLFRSSSYPRQALQENDTGRVGIALLVDEAGKVRDCMVEETSGFATLDTMSCQILTEHAKFHPAIGTDGKPAKSASFHRISWRIGA
jgi:TonB family protein